MGTKLSKSYAVSITTRARVLVYVVILCWISATTAQQLKAPIIVKSTFNANGQGFLCDSFNSSDPTKSVYGKYAPSVAGDNGGIICNDNWINPISIGSGTVYGTVSTGPNGTATVGSSGGVGSHAYLASNPGTIEPNGNEGRVWYSHDANVTFPLVNIPYTEGRPPEGPSDVVITTDILNSNYVFNSSAYPNPPPATGVSTNIVGTNTTSTYPGYFPGMVTNITAYTVACPAYPTAGTYIGGVRTNLVLRSKSSPPTDCYLPGSVVFNGHSYFYTAITSYTYNTISDYSYPVFAYNYAQFQTNAIYATNHYDHVLSSGDYYSDTTLSGSTVVLGNSRLVLGNGLNMSGSDRITIASGGSVTLYAHGSSCIISGAGIINLAGRARNFVLYHDGFSLSYSASVSDFMGVIIAPNADVSMNGGGSGSVSIEGAIMARSLSLYGPFFFHYDEDLASLVLLPPAWLSECQVVGSDYLFVVYGVPGYSCAVEGSTNLLDWERLTTNMPPFTFTNHAIGATDRKFFRAVWVK